MKRLLLLVLLGCIALQGVSSADVITLKDGSKIEGEVKRAGEIFIVTDASGSVTRVAAEKVAGFEVKAQAQAGPDAAMGRLASLRRASENVADIKQVLDRYRSFIDQNPNTPAAVAAEKEIKIWQDRQDQGLVKVADKWMTLGERDALRAKSTDIAIDLHGLLKQGRLKEAGLILDRSLVIDPQNMSLLYLHGVMQYQQEQIPPARKSFEAVSTTAPDHAPTLNNLGVILWRQNAHVAALGFYDRALLAAPNSREILDNVAEALNALPKEQHDSAVVKKLLRHFKEQDDAMQKKMADDGKYRWGASWVNEKELKRLQDQEKAIKDQITQISQDFDAIQRRITTIDRQIFDVTNEMALLDSQTYANGPNGQVIRLPYPAVYFTLSQQLAGLKAERAARVDDQERLRKSAKQAQQQLPAPKYTGIQKLIDADGMPLPAGVRMPVPATKPAS